MTQYTLGHQNDFSDGETRGFDLDPQDPGKRVFIVKTQDQFYCYRNSCPHTGAPLNWEGDRFLSLDQSYIQCSLHGALFRIENGQCIAGPCPGTRLSAVPIAIDSDGRLSVEL